MATKVQRSTNNNCAKSAKKLDFIVDDYKKLCRMYFTSFIASCIEKKKSEMKLNFVPETIDEHR